MDFNRPMAGEMMMSCLMVPAGRYAPSHVFIFPPESPTCHYVQLELAKRLGLPDSCLADLTVTEKIDAPWPARMWQNFVFELSPRCSVDLWLRFDGENSPLFSLAIPETWTLARTRDYVAQYLLLCCGSDIEFIRGDRVIPIDMPVPPGEVCVKFTRRNDFPLRFSTSEEFGRQWFSLLLGQSATWADARTKLAILLAIPAHLIKGSDAESRVLRLSDDLFPLRKSWGIRVKLLSPFIFFRAAPHNESFSLDFAGAVTVGDVRRYFSEQWNVDAETLGFSCRGMEISPIDELIQLETSEFCPIVIVVIRIHILEVGRDTFEVALPDDMRLYNAEKKAEEVVGQRIERLVPYQNGRAKKRDLDWRAMLSSVTDPGDLRLKVLLPSRWVYVRLCDGGVRDFRLRGKCQCFELMRKCVKHLDLVEAVIYTPTGLVQPDDPVPVGNVQLFAVDRSKEMCVSVEFPGGSHSMLKVSQVARGRDLYDEIDRKIRYRPFVLMANSSRIDNDIFICSILFRGFILIFG
jgi:hypothetical protein